MKAACTRRSASIASWMSSSECAGESGSDSTVAPASSATGSGCLARDQLAVEGQLVERQEVDRRRDVLGKERLAVGVAVAAGELRVDPHDVDVVRVDITGIPGDRRDPGQLGARRVVGGDVPNPDLLVLVDLLELDERERGEQVGQVHLEAGDADVVERPGRSAHQPQLVDLGRQDVVVGREDAALRARDVLRRVQRERRGERAFDRADLAPAVDRLDRVGRVLEHRNPVGEDLVQIGRLAGEMHGDDRLRPRGDRSRDQRGVDVQVVRLHVHEDRRGAAMDDDVRGRRPGDRGRDHLVAGADLRGEQRQMERSRPGREGHGVLRTDVFGEAPLEFSGTRTGGNPAGLERLDDGLDLLGPDRRRLEAEQRLAAGPGSGRLHGCKAYRRAAV